jgi:hypothetical protein
LARVLEFDGGKGDDRITEAKQYWTDVLIELIAQLQERTARERTAERQEFTNKLAALELQIADLKVKLAECNLALARAGMEANKLILPSSHHQSNGKATN